MKTLTHTNDSLNVVYFAQRHAGWHTYGKDKRTERAVMRAKELGQIEVNEFRQFRLCNSTPSQNPAIFKAQIAAKIFQPA